MAGPTSNHALFRQLSAFVARTAKERFDMLGSEGQLRDYLSAKNTVTSPGSPYFERSTTKRNIELDVHALPPEHTERLLINHFFATVGIVMPIISKHDVMAEYNSLRRDGAGSETREFRALINIMNAHAASSLSNQDPEVFYERSIVQLDVIPTGTASIQLRKFALYNGTDMKLMDVQYKHCY